jgi:hypothetical protein
MRDSGLPADVLLGKLKKDILFTLRPVTMVYLPSMATSALRAAEDELRA